MVPRWSPKGLPKRLFWRSFGVSFPGPLQGTQNGAKMAPKWSQNGAKIAPKWSKNSAKKNKN